MQEHLPNPAHSHQPVGRAPKGCGAVGIARGAVRLLGGMGYRVLVEFPLVNERRADIAGLDRRGSLIIVEVKSSLADFHADGKWPDYLGFCDAFCFAVDPSFPLSALPEGVGVIVADAYEGAVIRAAPVKPMSPARRKALTVRFARTAAARLEAIMDARREVGGPAL